MLKLVPHPDQSKFASRLASLGRTMDITLDSDLFRFINPAYSRPADVLNGHGALFASGRWNTAGSLPLSYTALSPETALAEALAHVRYFNLPTSKALPRVLVSLHINATKVIDLRDGNVRKHLVLSEDSIRHLDWRSVNRNRETAITQAWGNCFASAGYEAVIVPSAADHHGANVLVFPMNHSRFQTFSIIDEIQWPK